MPEIKATCQQTTATGKNAMERGQGETAIFSAAINTKSASFNTFLTNLNHENGRSAFACAEAQAFGLLLSQLNPPVNYNEIEFACPTSESGLLLWQLCGNCQQWLTRKSGWGPQVKYQLNQAALNILQPNIPATVTPDFNSVVDFPSLKSSLRKS